MSENMNEAIQAICGTVFLCTLVICVLIFLIKTHND
jgi:hypothetical protein